MEVMGIRMLPVSNTFSKFPRMVRDLSAKLNKKIDLTIEGENTELDRSVIEEINDPLIHLIRNSVDHGIETAEERLNANKPERATIKLTARHEQGRIILTVEDDGRGIDPDKIRASAVGKGILSESEAASLSDDEAINLIFSSGFSTAKVVNDVSGRGVGLDIVRNNIQRLNGTVMVETEKGKGTRFMVTLPLTLAIVPTLLVRVAHNTLAIPLVTVVETLRISIKEIQTVNSKPVIRLRDKVLPLLDMTETFGFVSSKKDLGYRYVVVVGMGKQMMGLAVDRLLGQEEVVVKSLGSIIGEVNGIASAAILGDGSVILIVDVQDLFQMTGQKSGGNKKE
jgi:two-component system chemotaxis sensor kinase CheA